MERSTIHFEAPFKNTAPSAASSKSCAFRNQNQKKSSYSLMCLEEKETKEGGEWAFNKMHKKKWK